LIFALAKISLLKQTYFKKLIDKTFSDLNNASFAYLETQVLGNLHLMLLLGRRP
jgi:hypothetical protein